jgi:branched-subunit amino acid transport protein
VKKDELHLVSNHRCGNSNLFLPFFFYRFFGELTYHPQIYRTFKYIPIAVLAAIIVPEIIKSTNIQNMFSEPRLVAGAIAIIVAWRTKNVILTITVGMVILYLIQYLTTKTQ